MPSGPVGVTFSDGVMSRFLVDRLNFAAMVRYARTRNERRRNSAIYRRR